VVLPFARATKKVARVCRHSLRVARSRSFCSETQAAGALTNDSEAKRRAAMNRTTNALHAVNAAGLHGQEMAEARIPALDWSGAPEAIRPTRAEARRRRLRREYNRKYMRTWRADTDKKQRKRRSVGGGARRGKAGRLRGNASNRRGKHGRRLCGFCRRHPAISQVTRLQICADTAKGFRVIRVPYCGAC